MALKPAFPYNIYRARTEYVENAEPADLFACVKFLSEVHGDAFATNKEISTMLNDTAYARDIIANYAHSRQIDLGHS